MSMDPVPAVSALREHLRTRRGSLVDHLEALIAAEFVPGGRVDVPRGNLLVPQVAGAPYEDLHAIVTFPGVSPRILQALGSWMGEEMIPDLEKAVKGVKGVQQEGFLRCLEMIGGIETVRCLCRLLLREPGDGSLVRNGHAVLNDIAARHDPESIGFRAGHSRTAHFVWKEHRAVLQSTPPGVVIVCVEDLRGKYADETLGHVISALEKPLLAELANISPQDPR